TIDGWALRLASTFPARSKYKEGIAPRRLNYLKIRKAAWTLLKANHITDVLTASYSRILVDEYQDCSLNQHAVVYYASRHLPTCVLGDPMQAVFGFGDDGLAEWDKHVCKHFPPVTELSTPWRWKNAGTEELGLWLLEARTALLKGASINLKDAPESVRWIKLDGTGDDYRKLVRAARCGHKASGETSLVIGDSRNATSRHKIAKNVPGIVAVEPVDLKDLTTYARNLDLTDGYSVGETLDFAESLITNVGAKATKGRIDSLKAGTARKAPSDLEAVALEVGEAPTFDGLARILSECSRQSGSRTYRPAVLRAAFRALSLVQSNSDITFEDAAVRVREENRAVGRQLPKAAIGSTLLLKGLEADHVVVLNAGELDARNLYVAMTRGAKSVTLCSADAILKPKPN
ncbi:MAG: UvrD-helicase domain-containing protein, partial [Cytophagales bacterium]|nr:UvrD-helicase domain-containing protein [Cytophagales bacterium]